MACKFSIGGDKEMHKCDLMPFFCPYQYYCTNECGYKQTATSDKCKYYEEAENSEQLNKK